MFELQEYDPVEFLSGVHQNRAGSPEKPKIDSRVHQNNRRKNNQKLNHPLLVISVLQTLFERHSGPVPLAPYQKKVKGIS